MADAANSSGSNGTLLGWSSLQRSLDSLGRRVERLSGTLTQTAKSGSPSLGGRQNSAQSRSTPAAPPSPFSASLASGAVAVGDDAAPYHSVQRSRFGGVRITQQAPTPIHQQSQFRPRGSSGPAAGMTATAPTTSKNGGGAVFTALTAATGGGHSGNGGHGGLAAGGGLLSQKGNGGLGSLGGYGGAGGYGGGGGYRAGHAAAQWTKRAASALAAYGDARMADMTTLELASSMAALGQGGPASTGRAMFLNQALGPSAARSSNTVALDQRDAISTVLARIRTSGGLDPNATPRDRAADQAWRSLGMVVGNASYGSTDAAVSAGVIQGPRSMHRAQRLGLGTIFDGDTHSYIGNAELARRMMDVATGTEAPTQERLAASLQETGKMRYLLNSMGWDAKTTEMFASYAVQLADLQQRGLDYRRADTLLAQASNQSDPKHKAAREELKKYGWNETQLQVEKDTAALDRSGDRAIFDSYIGNLKESSKAVEDWTQFVKKFLDLPVVREILGLGGAAAKFKDNPGGLLGYVMGDDAVASLKMRHNMPVNPGGGGPAVPNLPFGLDPGGGNLTHIPPAASAVPHPDLKADAPKTAPKSKGSGKRSQAQTSGGVSGAISYAMAQLGKPYLWGAEGPNAFDCSGLTMRAYQRAGINLPRTTWDQKNVGTRIPKDPKEWLPGDLIFPHGGAHVVMWLGNGRYIHAPNKRRPVSIDRGIPQNIVSVNRYVGGGASWTGKNNDKNGKGSQPQGPTDKANGRPDPNRPQDASGTGTDWAENVAQSIRGGSGILGQVSAEAYGAPERDVLMSIFASGGAGIGDFTQAAPTSDETPTPNREKTPKDVISGKSSKPKGGKTGGKAGNGGSPAANKRLGRAMAAARGWDGADWTALLKLWTRESGWNHHAVNRSSGAAGIPQLLPKAHPGVVNDDWMDNPRAQIQWGLNYIKSRYGSPTRAWAHSRRTGWYREGAWNIRQDEVATVHQGEMIIPAPEAGRIRDVLTRKEGASGTSPAGGGGDTWNFGPGSIVVHFSGAGGGADAATARSHARALLSEMERLRKEQKIAAGR